MRPRWSTPAAPALAALALVAAAGRQRVAAQAAPDAPEPPAAGAPAGAPCGMSAERGRPRSVASPRGYLGLRLSEVSDVRWTADGRLVRYCAYPLVVSVEPASPAEQAGLGAGDTVIAYGTRDLVRDGPVPLDRMLVPGEAVKVRLRRDGRTLVRTVVVRERPAAGTWVFGPDAAGRLGGADVAYARAWTEARRAAGGAPLAPLAPLPPAGGPGDPSVHVRVVVPGRAPLPARRPAEERAAAERLRERLRFEAFGPDRLGERLGRDVVEHARLGAEPWMTYLGALAPVPPSAWAAAHGPAALAGAQVVALDDDLREAVAGAPRHGVFVLKVLPGTPAAEAGLRAGDVITSAAGRPVETPAALQRALLRRAGAARAGDGEPGRSVSLRVTRAGAARDAVLRW